MFTRDNTRKINIGNVNMGGGSPVSVQSMTNTDTRDVDATVKQIIQLEDLGCDIIRVAVVDNEAAEAVSKIKKQIHIPIVTDIHFDYRLALTCIENGADKVRINPGNIGSRDRVEAVANEAKSHGVPIRIGINGGSLEKEILKKYGDVTPEALVESALGHIEILEALNFYDIAVSLKSSNVLTTVNAYKLMAEKRPYPLHVGVTEAGTVFSGTVKSSVGIGAILACGIGDTIRVSLTGSPLEEVKVGRSILQSMCLGKERAFEFISCPTCGRTRIDLIKIANEVEQGLIEMEKKGLLKQHIKVAVMGCAVNGPGEASLADIGLAGGDGMSLLFEHGIITGKFEGDDIANQFLKKIGEVYAGV